MRPQVWIPSHTHTISQSILRGCMTRKEANVHFSINEFAKIITVILIFNNTLANPYLKTVLCTIEKYNDGLILAIPRVFLFFQSQITISKWFLEMFDRCHFMG